MKKPLKYLISSGPTREYIDPVRFISNPSSGKMGARVAEAAAEAGHDVTIVSGPVNIKYPAKAEVIRVTTAIEMYESIINNFPDCDVLVMTAAVCDYRPVKRSENKIHKTDNSLMLRLERNPDIMFEAKRIRKKQIVVGFAAETHDLLTSARRKLEKKGMDMILANKVGKEGSGFASDFLEVTIMFRNKANIELGRCRKKVLSNMIVKEVQKLYKAR